MPYNKKTRIFYQYDKVLGAVSDLKKVLVIGSTRHQHVQCVGWHEVASINLVDFDAVVVNVRSLDPEVIKKLYHQRSVIRTKFARLWLSGGSLVVLGDQIVHTEVFSHANADNYFWSPISFHVVKESGDTINVISGQFSKYLSRFKKWDFFYVVPNGCLTSELTEQAGTPEQGKCHYRSYTNVFSKNRYDSMLAGEFSFVIEYPRTEATTQTGELTLLPSLKDIDDREAVGLALEDMLGLPQETPLPDWVNAVAMPLVAGFQVMIREKLSAIEALEKEVRDNEEKIRELERYKKLFYVGGRELEDLFSHCLERCGGIIGAAKYSDEEFILEHKAGIYLIECKGVGKSIARSHVVQLLGYLTKFEEAEGRFGKGILFGNAWKDSPLDERNKGNTPIFPSNVVSMAMTNDIALVSSIDFFYVFCRFLAGEVTGEAILDCIADAVGVVSFDGVSASDGASE